MPRMPDSPLRLEPFRAWRFVAGKVTALGAVTSPPYDVLEPATVRRLTESDLHNMVRLILPRDPGLGPHRYDDAAARLISWQQAGVVVRDDRPGLYVYEQRIGPHLLCGLVGALGLDPAGRTVLPHENVMPEWVDDRYQLMETTGADLEPILLAYTGGGPASDLVDAARGGDPWLVAHTDDGAEHRIWRLDSPGVHRTVATDLAGREALIADGHHRYTAYLRRLAADRPGTAEGLAMLVDHRRHPLSLDAIHRSVPGLGLAAVSSRTPASWRALPGRHQDRPHSILVTDGADWLTLLPAEPLKVPEVVPLHAELLPAWGVDPTTVGFHHQLDDALALAGPDRLAVELGPPGLDQVLSAAANDIRLPHKATSFGPKPRVGLLFRTL